MEPRTAIPSEIAEIINRKEVELLQKKQESEEAEKRQLQEIEMQGQIKWNEYVQQSLLKTPEWIRPYLDFLFEKVDYVRIAKGWGRVESLSLYFTIPGLASIEFDPQKNNWRSQRADWADHWDDETPRLNFTNSSYWRSDLEYVLGEARNAAEQYDEYLKQYAVKQEERARWQAQNDQAERESAARHTKAEIEANLEYQKEQAEEQALFDAIKNDPIAIHMLRAFVFLRDERSTFEQRLYEADESLSSVEGFWSNKAAELRRQADDAQRRADDEKSRLQNDLDDAEAKLKKAEKEQRGW